MLANRNDNRIGVIESKAGPAGVDRYIVMHVYIYIYICMHACTIEIVSYIINIMIYYYYLTCTLVGSSLFIYY